MSEDAATGLGVELPECSDPFVPVIARMGGVLLGVLRDKKGATARQLIEALGWDGARVDEVLTYLKGARFVRDVSDESPPVWYVTETTLGERELEAWMDQERTKELIRFFNTPLPDDRNKVPEVTAAELAARFDLPEEVVLAVYRRLLRLWTWFNTSTFAKIHFGDRLFG